MRTLRLSGGHVEAPQIPGPGIGLHNELGVRIAGISPAGELDIKLTMGLKRVFTPGE